VSRSEAWTADVGDLVGSFSFTVDRADVWPVDWAAYLDDPIYQDPVVAEAEGYPGIPVPIGGLIFFSHLDGDWQSRAGIDYRRSLAAERSCELLGMIYVGDEVTGRTVVAERFEKTRSSDGVLLSFVRLETEYRTGDKIAMRERVLYVTPERTA
jgi:hypothetical protein